MMSRAQELQDERDMAIGVLNGGQGMAGGDPHACVSSRVANGVNGMTNGSANGVANGAMRIEQQPISSL